MLALNTTEYVQIAPRSCVRIQMNKALKLNSFRWAINGTASTSDASCWPAVCSAPQSQLSLVYSPQRSLFAPTLPTPVRSLFSRVQARRDRLTPYPLFDVMSRARHRCILINVACSAIIIHVDRFNYSDKIFRWEMTLDHL